MKKMIAGVVLAVALFGGSAFAKEIDDIDGDGGARIVEIDEIPDTGAR